MRSTWRQVLKPVHTRHSLSSSSAGPFFYTFTAAFTGHVFGFSTFGTIYGLMTSLAGLANVGVTPLQVVARSYGYGSANPCVAILQLTIVTLWLKMLSAPTVFNKN